MPSRQTKPLLIKDQQLPGKLSRPQDSALTAPRPETESQPEFWRGQTFIGTNPSHSAGPEQLRHSWKVNCLTPKVNTFFGSLLITIFQKQNYLNQNQTPSVTKPVTALLLGSQDQ
jgi:hypothetical protein